eukprot:7925957-Ditylum_brightwellii.AAC.1
MDIMINNTTITSDQVRKIDYYRKFLRVTTLADIVTSDRTAIISDAAAGKKEKPLSANVSNKLDWTQQPQPS